MSDQPSSNSPTTEPAEVVSDLPRFSPPPPKRQSSGPDPMVEVDPPTSSSPTSSSSPSSSSPSSSSPSSSEPDAGDVGGFGDPMMTSPSATPGNGKSSLGSTEILEASRSFFADVFALAFGFLGFVLHQRLSPGEHNAAWLPTEDENTAVTAPLASIAARHAPIGDVVAGDVGDAIGAAVGVTAYGMRSIGDQAEAKRALEVAEHLEHAQPDA